MITPTRQPISPLPSRPIRANRPDQPKEPAEVSLLSKSAGVVVAAGAAGAGLICGGAQGMLRGARSLPAYTTGGFSLGTRIAHPLTGGAGALMALSLTGVVGLAVVAGGAVAPVAAFLQGTAEGAVGRGALVQGAAQSAARAGTLCGSAVLGAAGGALGALVGLCTLPTILYPPLGLKLIPQAVRAAAQSGQHLGTRLGGALGNGVGLGLGAAGGSLAALVVSTPQGVTRMLEVGSQVGHALSQLPDVASHLWEDGQAAGKVAAQCTGGLIGGVAGVLTGVLATPVMGVAVGLGKASDWGQKGYHAVAG